MIDRVFAGRYRITEKIGIGGMAEVYKATDETLGRTVAIKVMLPQYAADETFAVRFKQEAQAAANLQSPYIVNIYDWGYEESSQTYYIIMEYIRGTDLKTAIVQRGAINQRKVAEIGTQVAAALGVAHSYDVIHRDIKPQNIMVQPDGNAKVMDFGIARANNANMTQTGSVLGTAYYVSPEQAQGRALTPASDIYSLGVVLYEAVCGRVPFDGPDAVSIAVKQVNEHPVPPRALNADIDPALEAIILKAMAKQPAERFATADQMRRSLLEYLQGKTVSGVDSEARTRVISTLSVIPPTQSTAVMPQLATAATITRTGNAGASERMAGSDKNARTALIVALSCVFVVLALGLVLFLTFCSNSPAPTPQEEAVKVEVPRVVGLTQEEAKKSLENAGLVLGSIDRQNSDTVEEGKVISQNPQELTKVAKDSKVNLVISSGKAEVEIPDVRGLSQDEAKKKLEEKGFVVEVKEEPSDTVEEGKVVAQSPNAKTKAAQGATITIVVSKGAAEERVPNVVGFSRAQAEKALNDSGFNVIFTEDAYSATVPAGNVITQDKSGNAKKGDTITVTVSKGPEPKPEVSVPSIVGATYAEATDYLTTVGLVLDPGSGYSEGMIVDTQTPAPGTKLAEGSSVRVTWKVRTPVNPPTP